MKPLSWNDRKETCDTLFEGRLRILQKRDGYRFSIDALLLAHFAEAGPKDRIIDLGTGCGIVPLILIFRRKASQVIGAEIQASLADLARRNAALNRYASRIKIWEKDLKDLITKKLQGTFDLVLTNPPYRKIGSGRINPHEEKAVARHEIKATLDDVLRVAHGLLKDRGRLVMIFPASRAADLIRKMAGFHLEPKRLQFVHSHEKDEARLVLIEALKEGHAQVKVLPPLFLYDSGGTYTPIARELLR
jgi:tRNA1Val (adenine37-N6)-methyltransferase